jgi:hypothetical protein
VVRQMRRSRGSGLGWVIAAAVLSACSTSADPPAGAGATTVGSATSESPAALLDRLVDLAAQRPFTASKLSELTGHTLKPASGSNKYFTIHRSTTDPKQSIAAVEVREPTELSAGKGGMLLLDLAGPCIKRDDIGDRFGKPASLVEPPRLGSPPDTPEYVSYAQPWGTVRLGFSRTSECLVKAVFDAAE